MSEVARCFGENLRYLRKDRGMSQEGLGSRCSLHRTEIGLPERGARVPRVDTLLAGITWVLGATQAGGFEIKLSLKERRRGVRERAAKFRAKQEEESDAVQLIRESREELDERAERWMGGEENEH